MSRGISATALDAGKVCSWRNIVTGTAVANVASPSLQNTQKGQQKNAEYHWSWLSCHAYEFVFCSAFS